VPGIIDGRAWLAERRRFLRDELAKDPDEQQRSALEAELAAVEAELEAGRPRWWRWVLGGFRLPR
jgi:hypothetical protein